MNSASVLWSRAALNLMPPLPGEMLLDARVVGEGDVFSVFVPAERTLEVEGVRVDAEAARDQSLNISQFKGAVVLWKGLDLLHNLLEEVGLHGLSDMGCDQGHRRLVR